MFAHGLRIWIVESIRDADRQNWATRTAASLNAREQFRHVRRRRAVGLSSSKLAKYVLKMVASSDDYADT